MCFAVGETNEGGPPDGDGCSSLCPTLPGRQGVAASRLLEREALASSVRGPSQPPTARWILIPRTSVGGANWRAALDGLLRLADALTTPGSARGRRLSRT